LGSGAASLHCSLSEQSTNLSMVAFLVTWTVRLKCGQCTATFKSSERLIDLHVTTDDLAVVIFLCQ